MQKILKSMTKQEKIVAKKVTEQFLHSHMKKENMKDFNSLDINLENGVFYGKFRIFSELKQNVVSATKNMKTEIFISYANKEKPQRVEQSL